MEYRNTVASRCWLLVLTVSAIGGPAAEGSAPGDVMRFRRLNRTDGLASDTVLSAVQDHDGFMWFGTAEGLNRYDGHNFIHFRHIDDDPRSLSHDYVDYLFVDRDGQLWAGTKYGLDLWNPETQSFRQVLYDSSDPDVDRFAHFVRKILQDGDGTVWAGCRRGLFAVNPRTLEFRRFDLSAGGDPPDVYDMVIGRGGRFWLALEPSGLAEFDPATGGCRLVNHEPLPSIMQLCEDASGTLWAGTWGRGAFRFDPQSETLSKDESLDISTAFAFLSGRDGELWIGTYGEGVCRILPGGRVQRASYEPGNEFSLGNNEIISFCQSRDGMVWICTANGGVSKYSPRYNQFHHLEKTFRSEYRETGGPVLDVYAEGNRFVWFGLMHDGLIRYDPMENACESFQLFPDAGKAGNANTVWDIPGRANNGELVVRSETGLHWFDDADSSVRDFEAETGIAAPAGCLFIDEAGLIWAAGGRRAVRYNAAAGEWTEFPLPFPVPESGGLFEVRGNHAYLANHEGWAHFADLAAESSAETRLYVPRETEEFIVHDMCVAPDGTVWLGTNRGLFHCDPRNETLIAHLRGELPDDEIRSVRMDEAGFLWIATLYGIVKLDPRTRRYDHFTTNDGLIANGFYPRALEMARGRFFAGTPHGVVTFDPDEVKTNNAKPPVRVTAVRPFGNPGDNLLRESAGAPLRLPHRDNHLTFEFAALDYVNPAANRYRCKMDGVDPDWRDIGNRNSVSYSNLPPGSRRFRVIGSNNNGVWGDAVSVPFSIEPPFWRTGWFYALSAATATSSLFAVYALRVWSIQRKNRLLEAQIFARTMQLRNERDYLDSIVNTSPIAILAFEPEGGLAYANPEAVKRFRLDGQSIKGKKWWTLPPSAEDQSRLASLHRRLKNEPRLVSETALSLPGGTKRAFVWRFVPHCDENGDQLEILAFADDVTDKIEREILSAAGREQQRIGREIHDNLCQTLAGVHYMCGALAKKRHSMPADQAGLVERIQQHIQDATTKSRLLARGLALHELERHGLPHALKDIARSTETLFGKPCAFERHGPTPNIEPREAAELCRIAREACANAAKHANANRINLSLVCNQYALTLTVKDDGTGLRPRNAASKGMGLAIMRKRADMIGARLTVNPGAETGTEVRCVFPLPQPQPKAAP